MIELHPFTTSDFETFKSWIQNAEELFQFAGPLLSFPVTNDQLRNYLDMEDKHPMKVVLSSTKESIGHCEFNFENGNKRLSRILIARKDLRGQKIGEQVVREMAKMLFKDPHIDQVDLNTFSWNKAAISCYEKVGFKINPNQSEIMQINGNNWTKINMVLKREEFEGIV